LKNNKNSVAKKVWLTLTQQTVSVTGQPLDSLYNHAYKTKVKQNTDIPRVPDLNEGCGYET
jgi:hypothetical protein